MVDRSDRAFARPVVVCSRCLGFDNCRYDGQMLRNSLVEALVPFADLLTPCPENDIGLGTPRHPVRMVVKDSRERMVQLVTSRDVTELISDFSRDFMNGHDHIDGFILKSRSPSCGLYDVKRYPPGEKKPPLGKGAGFFGAKALEVFPGVATEDESRLGNSRIRDHFLTWLFTLADFRSVKTPAQLVAFQSRHKLLLMAYSQKEMRILGRITASQNRHDFSAALEDYSSHLFRAFSKGPSYSSHVNVLEHGFGYVSKKLKKEERMLFLDSLEMYREERTPLAVLKGLLRSWIIRFDVAYLSMQSYLEPYPRELNRELKNFRNRDYWGR